MLNLRMTTVFSQLNIGRIIEMLSSPSESNFFSYQNNSKIAFKSEKLGFFDSELSEKYSTGDLIYLDKNIIYKNVHLFIEYIRDIVRIKISIIVQIHLSIYLRKIVLN
jgi:hypothetical protein